MIEIGYDKQATDLEEVIRDIWDIVGECPAEDKDKLSRIEERLLDYEIEFGQRMGQEVNK